MTRVSHEVKLPEFGIYLHRKVQIYIHTSSLDYRLSCPICFSFLKTNRIFKRPKKSKTELPQDTSLPRGIIAWILNVSSQKGTNIHASSLAENYHMIDEISVFHLFKDRLCCVVQLASYLNCQLNNCQSMFWDIILHMDQLFVHLRSSLGFKCQGHAVEFIEAQGSIVPVYF